ncbi:MAG: sulfotransferase [Pseudomonadales bacterium]|nr:sulfotransferase [Pseudomonadales bacterium]
MTLKVIGAGLGRTGTLSLKLALEQLLGGPCYHMLELFQQLDEHAALWLETARGERVNWDRIFAGYCAAVDEPASLMWQQLLEYYPDALVVLSVRDAEKWWKSANDTILPIKRKPPPTEPPGLVIWYDMMMELYKNLYPQGVDDPRLTQQCFLDHMARVKREVPANRLLVWEAGDGWEPLCAALGLPVPDSPFPHANTTEEFKARQIHD